MTRLLRALAVVAIALSLLVPVAWAANPRSFSQTLDTSTKTSEALDTLTGSGSGAGFTVAVTGTFSAHWRLQRSVDNGSNWLDYFVIDQPDAFAVPAQAPALWRLSGAGVGDFTSGSASVSFVKGGSDAATPLTRLMTKDRGAVSSANPLPVTGAVTTTGTVTATIGSALPAGSAIIGKVGIDQTTPGTTNGVQVNAALPAGTATIGGVKVIDSAGTNVGGVDSDGRIKVGTPATIRISATQTVTAALYTTRNAVGGKITFGNATRVAAGGGVIQTCVLRDKAGQSTVSYDLILLDADPSATTVTDKSAVALNTADLGKAIGVVQFSVGVLAAASTMAIFTSPGQGFSFKLGSGTTLYGILVVTGAPTYASTSDVSVDCTIMPD